MTAAVENMAYAGKVPWHGLGIQVDENISTEEMIKEAGLDWTVEKRPLDCRVDSKRRKAVPGYKALVRSSDQRVLTIVGQNWKPIQNSQMFDFLREFVRAGDMKLETAGSLRDGNDVWALANLGESFALVNDDEVKGYLLISLPHEYGRSLKIMFTPIRVVCNNTLTYALNSANMQRVFTYGHRKRFDETAALLAKESLGLAMEGFADFQDAAEKLSRVEYKKKDVIAYIGDLFPSTSDELSRSAENVVQLLDTQPGADLAGPTYWNAVNAVTYFIDHHTGRTADGRMQSAWFGAKSRVKRQAVHSALEYAKAA